MKEGARVCAQRPPLFIIETQKTGGRKPMKETKGTSITIKHSEGKARIATNITKHRHRLEKLAAEHPEAYRFAGTDADGRSVYECGAEFVTIRKPPTQKQLDTWRKAGPENAHYLPHMNH